MNKIMYLRFGFILLMVFLLFACDAPSSKEILDVTFDSTTIEASYVLDTFDLSTIKLEILYDDQSTQLIELLSSMISSSDRSKLSTVGTHHITVTYQTFTLYLTLVLVEPAYEIYEISFIVNGGNQLDVLSLYEKTSIDLPIPTKQGYTFDGWYLDSELVIVFDQTVMPQNDLILYAKWSPKVFYVTFLSYDDHVFKVIEVSYGHSFLMNDTPVRVGYSFLSWDTPFLDVFDDQTINAQWGKNTYEISFQTNSNILLDSIDVLFAEEIHLPILTEDDRIFEGWYLDATFDTPFSLETMPAYHITLYAFWTIPLHSISFETFDGSTIQTIFVYQDDLIPDLETPTLFNHTFIGWFMDVEFMVDFDLTYMPHNDIILYALWVENQTDPNNFLSMPPQMVVSSPEGLINMIAFMMFHKHAELEITLDYQPLPGQTIQNEISEALNQMHKHIHVLDTLSYYYNESTRNLKLLPIFLDEAYLTASPIDVYVQRPFYDQARRNLRPLDFNDFNIYSNPLTYAVESSEQLYYVMERGFRPIPVPGSQADLIYHLAKDVLRHIITDDMTDIEKLLAIQAWLVEYVVYDATLLDLVETNQSNLEAYKGFYLEGIFEDYRAVCDGFSKAVVLLATLEGIETIRIIGAPVDPSITSLHSWNKVKLNGHWYVIDTTSANLIINQTYEVFTNRFFLITDADMASRYMTLSDFSIIADQSLNIYDSLFVTYQEQTISRNIDSQESLNLFFLYYKDLNTFIMSIDVYISFICENGFVTCLTQAFHNSGLPGLSYVYRPEDHLLIIWSKQDLNS